MQSARVAQADGAFAGEFALPVPHLISILIPNFFGEPVHTGYWGEGRHTEFILYPGLAALILASSSVRAGSFSTVNIDQRRKTTFWVIVGLLGLLLALGPAGGLHTLAVQLIPPLRFIRAPVRFGFWFIFAVAALAGWGLDGLQVATKLPTRVLIWSGIGAGVLGLIGLTALLAFRLEFVPNADRLYHTGAASLRSAFVSGLSSFVLSWIVRSVPRFIPLAAVCLVLSDLWGYGVPQLRLISEGYDSTWAKAAEAVESNDRVLPWGLFLFFQNGGMDHAIPSVFGYDPIVLDRYEQFTSSVPDPRARTFDLLNARYLLAHADEDFGEVAQPKFIAPAGDYALFERADYMPRAWLVGGFDAGRTPEEQIAFIHSPDFDPRTTAVLARPPDCEIAADSAAQVRVSRYDPGRIDLVVESSVPGILLLSEQYYTGWQVHIDGQPAEIFPVDVVLQGVCTPPGVHQVEFRFVSGIVWLGFTVTVLSILLGAVGAYRPLRKQQF